MTAVIGSNRAGPKPRPAAVAWAVAWAIAAVSVAGFAAAWVLAARNRNLLGISADFGPDRFLVTYAIDRIISRTVSYALVTGVVVAVYLGCVALLTKVLPFRGSVGIAAAVLAAVAVFNPLRRRVQAAVDRRFDRARYDAERVVAQFSVQLREQVDLDVLGKDLLGVVDQVLAPAHLALWLTAAVPPDGNGGTAHSGTAEFLRDL